MFVYKGGCFFFGFGNDMLGFLTGSGRKLLFFECFEISFAGSFCGVIQSSNKDEGRITGIRSWMARISPALSLMRIVNEG